MSDRETPMTDEEKFVADVGDWGVMDAVPADFARDLERKLAEAKEVMHAATLLIAAKGRHNTKLAYDGLREALARIDGNVPVVAPATLEPESKNDVVAG